MIDTSRLVTFLMSFRLAGTRIELPPGGYLVETDQTSAGETVAYFRLPLPYGTASRDHSLAIDPRDLEMALGLDRQRYQAKRHAVETAPKEGI